MTERTVDQLGDTMKTATRLIVSAMVLTLSACGKEAHNGPARTEAVTVPAVQDKTVSAPIFSEKLKKPNCLMPAPVATSGVGFDLNGIRLGMARDDAVRLLYCGHKRYFHYIVGDSFFGLTTDDGKLGPQTVSIHDGVAEKCDPDEVLDLDVDDRRCSPTELNFKDITDDLHLATPGLPGQERVQGIWRSETFAKATALSSVLDSFESKFGAPADKQEDGGLLKLFWQWSPDGQRGTTETPDFWKCNGNISPSSQGGNSFVKGCGLTVKAIIYRAADNRDLATGYTVGMMDQDKTYAAFADMKNVLAAEDVAKQQQQLNDAKTGGEKPQL